MRIALPVPNSLLASRMPKSRVFAKLLAGLLVGSAPAGLHAQENKGLPASNQSATGIQASPMIEFRSADGKPLPPEVQRRIEEQIKNDPQFATRLAQQAAQRDDIVVSARRPRGSVISDIPPERTLRPDDIRAYGANTIAELLQTLGPQVRSGRGHEDQGPIVLLNGKRVSSFAEIAKIPTEAIERMDVLPEEVALSYGYSADQKVVNVVVFERFNSSIGQVTFSAPTEGGRDTTGATANYLLINDDMRFNFDAEYGRSGALLESERNVQQALGSPDLGRFRTLLPASERFALNGTLSGELIESVSSALNGSFDKGSSKSLYGFGPAAPITGEADSELAHLGTTFGGAVGRWLWTLTGNYDRATVHTTIDTGVASNEARSINSSANADLIISGQLLKLPAGPISASVRVGADTRDFTSRSLLAGVEQRFDVSRDRAALQLSVDVPVARRLKDERTWVGDFSLNFNLALQQLSDFGTLHTFGSGLHWSPLPSIRFSASASREAGAPTVEQLGAPLLVTPNVRTFDLSRSETVEVTRSFGGNPDLRADERRVLSLGLAVKPFSKTDLTLSADYLSTRINDPIAASMFATPALEAVFPERFTRGEDGQLLRIDARPLNFERSNQEHLRFGLNFTKPLGYVPPHLRNARMMYANSEADAQRKLPPGAILSRSAPNAATMRGVENLRSRLFLNAYYTFRTEDQILLRKGEPVLDLLDGSAIGARGGRPRHEVELQAGAFKSGLGAQIAATWQSGTAVLGAPSGFEGTTGDLRFKDYGTVNFNLFANLADRFDGPKALNWLKGTRISLSVANLLNARPDVRDAAGATPISYQGAYLNPLGRTVSFSVRKVF